MDTVAGTLRVTPAHVKKTFTSDKRQNVNNGAYLGYDNAHAALSQRDAWVTFLSRFSWSFFGTYTFREVVHPERASKAFRFYIRRINESLYGKRFYRHGEGIAWVRALEYQRREVIHYHALLGGEDELRGKALRDLVALWVEIVDAFAKVERIETYGAVLAYCAKYTSKGGEIDLGGALGRAEWAGYLDRLRGRLL